VQGGGRAAVRTNAPPRPQMSIGAAERPAVDVSYISIVLSAETIRMHRVTVT